MNKVERRSVSFEPTKKGPWFQGSQHFRVTTEIKKLRWLIISTLEFRAAHLCSSFYLAISHKL